MLVLTPLLLQINNIKNNHGHWFWGTVKSFKYSLVFTINCWGGDGGCRRRVLASVSVSSLSVSSLNHLLERFGSVDIVGHHILDFHINTGISKVIVKKCRFSFRWEYLFWIVLNPKNVFVGNACNQAIRSILTKLCLQFFMHKISVEFVSWQYCLNHLKKR